MSDENTPLPASPVDASPAETPVTVESPEIEVGPGNPTEELSSSTSQDGDASEDSSDSTTPGTTGGEPMDPQVTESASSDIPTSVAMSDSTENSDSASGTSDVENNPLTTDNQSSSTSTPSDPAGSTSVTETENGLGSDSSTENGTDSSSILTPTEPTISSSGTSPDSSGVSTSEPSTTDASSDSSTETGTGETESSPVSSDGSIPEGTQLPDGITATQVGNPNALLDRQEIEHRFGTHRATLEGPEASNEIHKELRRNFKSFAKGLNYRLPASREAALAFTALEEASMWAHKAIALKDPIADDEPEPITAEDSENRVALATLQALKDEARKNPFVKDQLASLGLI